MSSALLDVLAASTLATLQFLLLASVGALAAVYPKEAPVLATPNVKMLARLSNDIFLPAWTVSTIGARIDLQSLREDWAICIAGFLTVFLGLGVADLTALVFRPNRELVPAMRVSIAFVNALSIPLVLLGSLCESRRVNAQAFDKSATDCKEEASAKLNVFMVAWHACMWSYGYATLERTAPKAEKHDIFSWQSLKRTAQQPNIIGLFVGLFVALVPSLSVALFRQKQPTPLRPLGAALEVLGNAMVASRVLISASAFVHGHIRRRAENKKRADDKKLETTTTRENIIVEEEDSASPKQGDIELSGGEAKEDLHKDEDQRHLATLVWFVSVRLIIVPLLAYGASFALRRTTNFGLSNLARLVILVEFAAPSAQTILTVLYALGLSNVAETLAPFFLVQYIVSIFTMTAFGAWALYIIYEA